MVNIPKDPVILLSYVNTQLRDYYESFEDLCGSLGVDRKEIVRKLSGIGYQYSESVNQFI